MGKSHLASFCEEPSRLVQVGDGSYPRRGDIFWVDFSPARGLSKLVTALHV